MKYRYSLFGIGLASIVFVLAFIPKSVDYQERESVLMFSIIEMLDQLHYHPAVMDDEFSEKAFNSYLKRMDGRKNYLLASEVEALEVYSKRLDDEAKYGTFEFFDISVERIEQAIVRAEKIFEEVIDEEIELHQEGEIELASKKYDYAKDEEELKSFWQKRVYFEIMERVARKMERQEEEDFDGEVQTEEEMIEDARKAVKKNYERRFDNIKRNRRVDWLSVYLNSMVNLFDPHTGYFKPKDKQDFDMRMSGTLEGIGAVLLQDGDYVKVQSIVPGGPAWKQKDLKENDKIIKVAQGDDEPIEVVGWHINDVIGKIRGKKGTKVRLTVKQDNGDVLEIPIIRDVIVFEDSYVKSFILEHEDFGQKIGYINLPSFYAAAFGSKGGRSSGEDVKIEIEKLNQSGVEGVILDLRSNGGGSLRDVVDMSGLFIEQGPIVQVKSKDRAPYVLNDNDPSVQYSGPVIVLVNSFSASASEILAAALQDYNRAVIVGASSTYGKGTVQRFFNIDKQLRGHDNLKPLGQVKITTQKFYRIDGGTTQLEGVVPDIVLPDPYNYIEIGERENKNALAWTEIEPVTYTQDVYRIPDLKVLRSKSEERIRTHETFAKIDEYASFIKERRDDTEESLNIDTYRTEQALIKAQNKEFDKLHKKIEGLDASIMEVDVIAMEGDTTLIAKYEDNLKSIKKDIYIEEALAILYDMIAGH